MSISLASRADTIYMKFSIRFSESSEIAVSHENSEGAGNFFPTGGGWKNFAVQGELSL